MYSETDLDAAVKAGALTPDAVASLRQYMAAQRAAPVADEEYFRLITGFNDIFVAISAIILLAAVGWIGAEIHPSVGSIAVAGTAWGLAEYFTRIRRMAFPSIILLLAFTGGVASSMFMFLTRHGEELLGDFPGAATMALISAAIGIITAGATWFHWRRFHVPITIAAGTAATVATLVALVLSVVSRSVNDAETVVFPLILFAGFGVFAFAMWWDMSDRARQTGRSDVAFWLHLLAAPMIAHSLFSILGIMRGDMSSSSAILVLALYVLFGIVALIVDRRALLVSALAYVLYAMAALFDKFGVVGINIALTALIIGSALLMLSAFWQHARRLVLGFTPENIRAMVPDAVVETPRVAAA